MTWNHVFFIPIVAMLGIFIGFVMGARAARNSFDLERKRDEERAAARAEREARKAARKAAEADGSGGDARAS
ncbi:MAG: hypothetical protein H6709_10070 [Kofleriaceae bacterium]|nr:hypothetical protein [Myxococcales bacterium]MCB9572420.1 hypothetical protein [Kofleriaceae bacterium]